MGSSLSLQQWTQECPKGQSWVHCCSYFILMTCPMSLIHKFGCLRMIASCISPYVPWRTRSCSSRTCLPWSNTYGMRFNASKCNIMRISRARNPITRFYSLCGQVLLEVDTAKYLGVNLSAELSWSPHVSGVCSKANSTLGFLRRNLRKCPPSLKETAYISLCNGLTSCTDRLCFCDRSFAAVQRVVHKKCQTNK